MPRLKSRPPLPMLGGSGECTYLYSFYAVRPRSIAELIGFANTSVCGFSPCSAGKYLSMLFQLSGPIVQDLSQNSGQLPIEAGAHGAHDRLLPWREE